MKNCKKCGKEFDAEGTKRTHCDDCATNPRIPKSQRTARPTDVSAAADTLLAIYEGLGLVATLTGLPATATACQNAAKTLKDETEKYLAQCPGLLKILNQASSVSGYSGLVIAHGITAIGIFNVFTSERKGLTAHPSREALR